MRTVWRQPSLRISSTGAFDTISIRSEINVTHCDQSTAEKLKASRAKQRELEKKTEALDTMIGDLTAEVNRAGGPRLQQLPGLIQAAEVTAADKRSRFRDYMRCVKACPRLSTRVS